MRAQNIWKKSHCINTLPILLYQTKTTGCFFVFLCFFGFWIRKLSSATRIAKNRKSAHSHSSLELTPKRILENHLELQTPKGNHLPTKFQFVSHLFFAFFQIRPPQNPERKPPFGKWAAHKITSVSAAARKVAMCRVLHSKEICGGETWFNGWFLVPIKRWWDR